MSMQMRLQCIGLHTQMYNDPKMPHFQNNYRWRLLLTGSRRSCFADTGSQPTFQNWAKSSHIDNITLRLTKLAIDRQHTNLHNIDHTLFVIDFFKLEKS